MSLTVACVWVHGHLPYPVEYVTRLHAMARRWIARPFEFVCLTDHAEQLPAGITPVPVPAPGPHVKGWWAKLELFNPANQFTGRVLYLDLDTLLVADLEPIIRFPASFALAPHAGTFDGRDGRRVVKRFNSSVMVWDGGERHDLFLKFSPSVTQTLWGDQDWIGLQAPDAAVMPSVWFPRLSEFAWPAVPEGAKVVLCKKPKNQDAAKSLKGFAEAWG